MPRMINYKLLANLRKWPKDINNFIITGPLRAKITKSKEHYHFMSIYTLKYTLHVEEKGEEFNSAIRNIIYSSWLVKKGYDPHKENVWIKHQEDFFSEMSKQHPVKLTDSNPNYEMTLYHSSYYHSVPLVKKEEEEEVIMPQIMFDNLYKVKGVYYPRFELLEAGTIQY
jgi:hypothetical protein